MGVLNCDDPINKAKDCSNPKTFQKPPQKIGIFEKKNTKNAVHIFRAFLCKQLQDDAHENAKDDSNTEKDNASIAN